MALTKLITDLIDGSLGTDWQATPKTANFTAVAGEGYFVDTTSAAITVTLPSSPTAGDEVTIVDYAGTADTNAITITSSDNINGASSDPKINYERGGVSMVYVDATQGWIAYNATNETAIALAQETITVDYLVVAGGGGGGRSAFTTSGASGGGGGAGEYLYVETENLLQNTNYTVSVGAGGAKGVSGTRATQGIDSIFNNKTVNGGGRGAASVDTGFEVGGSGGSGGGGVNGNSGGSSVLTASGNGNDGGGGVSSGNYGAGGGGGAGSAGQSGTSTAGGNGGNGLSNSITGTPTYYAGGGGGGTYLSTSVGTGGLGGGANAGYSSNPANATNNLGGGGGGGSYSGVHHDGSNGGSGVVIIRYPDVYTITETTSPTVLSFTTDDTTVSGTKITTFTAGANGTIQFS